MRDERWSDRDLENLFAGRGPTEGDLACLAPLIGALRREADAPSREQAETVASMLAEAAKTATDGAGSPQKSVRWRRRLITIGGAAALATVGIGGAAVASDGAAPGDVLYPVDQAFEMIGIGDGGTHERLDEAVRLTERGQTDKALEHAANALKEEGNDEAAQALVQAATAVQNEGAEQSIEVRSRVSEMLQWMESTDSHGKDFGQGVSDRAQGIKDTASRGNSADAPGHTKDDSTQDGSTGTSGKGHHKD